MTVYQKPKFYLENVLRKARTGDDGTDYASCPSAKEDADDRFSVLGDLARPADVAALSSLIGCEAVFGTTGNRYRMTGVDTAVAVKSSIAVGVPKTQTPVTEPIVYNGEVYLLAKSALLVLNQDTLQVVRSRSVLDLGTVGDWAFSPDNEYILLKGTDAATGYQCIHKLRRSSLVLEATGVCLSSEAALVGVCCDSTYVYGAVKDGSNLGGVVRFLLATMDRIGRTDCSGAEYNPSNMKRDPATGILYMYANNNVVTPQAVIVKFSTGSSVTRVTALTLLATELQARGMDLNATDLYVGVYAAAAAGSLVKISLSSFTRTAAVAFTGSEYDPGSVVLNGTHAFTSTAMRVSSYVTYIVRCTLSPFARVDAWSGALKRGARLAVDATRLYAGGENNHLISNTGSIVSVTLSTYLTDKTVKLCTDTTTHRVAEDATSYYTAMVIDGDGSVVVSRVTKSSGAVLTSPVLSQPGSTSGVPPGISVSEGVVYVGLSGYLARLYADTMAEIDTLASTGLHTCLRVKGAYLFSLVNDLPGIRRFTLSPFAVVDTVAFSAGENTPLDMALNDTHAFAVCNLYMAQTKIVRCTLSPFARVDAVTLNATEEYSFNIAIDATNWFVTGRVSSGAQGYVAYGTLSPFARSGASALDAADQYPRGLTQTGAKLLVACVDGSSVPRIVRLAKSPLAREGHTALTGYTDPREMITDSENQGVVMATEGGYASAVICRIYEKLSLATMLQTADVGGAFTVRAGLTCGQQDTSQPVDQAADTLLSPVMTGLVNTELHLRAHAPNMIADGGAESGVLTTSGPAGANWSIESGSPLEGAKSFKWDTAADNNKTFTGKLPFKAGKTYTILMKVQSVGGDPAADVLEIQVKNVGTGTNVDAGISGNKPAITTAAAWRSFDITPDFDTDRWEAIAVPALANKGAATAILVDEVYIYEKVTVDTFIAARHNWTGRGPMKVNAWRCSPLRSTASIAGGDGTELLSVTVDSITTLEAALTSNAYPVFELVIPAAAGWAPELGEAYIGPSWQSPRWFKGPFNPYKTDEGNRRSWKISFGGLPTSLRSTVETFFDLLRDNESLFVKHDTHAPILMEGKGNYDATEESDRMTLTAELVEKV